MSAPSRLVGALDVAGLVAFDLPLTIPRHPYWLVSHRAAAADPAAQWFRALVQRAVGA